MNEEIKKEWVSDLRSGKYTQGEGHLNVDYQKFCCLGVLCEQAVRKGIIPEPDHNFYGIYFYGAEEPTAAYLPDEVSKWAGLYDQTLDISKDELGISLAELNDSGYSFELIADIIDEKL